MTIFKRILTISAFCAIFLGAIGVTQSTAQEVKIGYVEPQAVLAKMPEMKAVQQRLQNFAERKQKELAEKEQELDSEIQNYQQRSAVISDDAKQKEEERLGQLNAQLQQFRSQLQQEMQQKQQELVGPLLDQIGTAIDSVAKEMNLTYVLNTTTSSGDAIILYASDEAQEKYDITDQVMEQLGI